MKILFLGDIVGREARKTVLLELLKLRNKFDADIIINTGHTDEVFNFEHGELSYSGRQLIKVVLPSEYAFDNDYEWVHYSGEEEYTRIVDFKKVTQHKSPNCLLSSTISSILASCSTPIAA